jgi:hypothetical protein
MSQPTNNRLEDLFDECINRLTQGESVEAILKDYPHEADSLRPLLEMSEWIRQAQAEPAEIQTAKNTGRTRLEDKLAQLDAKPKRVRSNNWMWLGVAASFAFAFGAGLMLSMTLMAPTVGNVFTNFTRSLSLGGSTPTRTPVSLNPSDGGGSDVAYMTTATMAFMGGSSGGGSAVDTTPMMTATALISEATSVTMLSMATTTPAPTMPAPMGTMMPPMTATRVSDADIVLTATAIGEYFISLTSEPAFVATSVYGMTPSGGSSDIIICSGRECTLPDAPGEIYTTVPTTPASFDNLQVQPLKAGEIDDNAMWDDYLLYRRNYENQYGDTMFITLDVRNRAIVRVLDQNNQPVLGASVMFYAQMRDEQRNLILSQYTQADGRTLFLPYVYTMPNITYYLAIASKDGYEGKITWVKSDSGTFTIILDNYTRKEAGQ